MYKSKSIYSAFVQRYNKDDLQKIKGLEAKRYFCGSDQATGCLLGHMCSIHTGKIYNHYFICLLTIFSQC